MSDSLQPCGLGTIACQAPLSIGFSRQEYRSGLPCASPRDLPDPGIERASLMSPAVAGGFFTTSASWEALINCTPIQKLNLKKLTLQHIFKKRVVNIHSNHFTAQLPEVSGWIIRNQVGTQCPSTFVLMAVSWLHWWGRVPHPEISVQREAPQLDRTNRGYESQGLPAQDKRTPCHAGPPGGVGGVLWNRVVNQRLAEASFAITREWMTLGSWWEDVIGLFE